MKKESGKTVRCGIYTRVSSDSGLEQDFNSLDAQHEASQAYIKSQAHAGWTLIRTRYDDGGYSGGSTERPALQRLLEDVKARRVDIIVVYKVDRLTRSLADFAKLVELFDAHGVSFVSVTQQFNTTTSMGRLTLNVLLSFAQFEREVTSERIRDKVAASKRKGLWVGGNVCLGYAAVDRKVVVLPDEAETVRQIFEAYARLGSLSEVQKELRQRGIVSKHRTLKDGRKVGGIDFSTASLANLLHNRFYIGEVDYKGEILKGPQEPILDRALFDQVQEKLAAQRIKRVKTNAKGNSLLTGRIFDDSGNGMTPTYAVKNGVHYRYYISTPLLHGKSDIAGTVARVPAADVEDTIVKALRERLQIKEAEDNRMLLQTCVERVEIQTKRVVITLKPEVIAPPSAIKNRKGNSDATIIHIPWTKPPTKRGRDIVLPAEVARDETKPIKAARRAKLIASIAKGRRWLDELVSGQTKSPEEIAQRERCSVRKVNMTISLAFLGPNLVKASVEGSLPRGITMTRMYGLNFGWADQHRHLGLDRTGS
jgi:DNA invertase Pin-like site-specific DNA recombinase/DNA-binding CsgD family transcriptional regulator